MEAAEELKEASAGTANPVADSRESDLSGACGCSLESAAVALDAATVAPEACSATAARLRDWPSMCAQPARRAPRPTTWKPLSAPSPCSRKALCCVDRCCPEDLLVGLKEHAARELAPYRSRMGTVQLRQVERQFVQKQLLVHYNLPRLSLFYMSSNDASRDAART